MPSHEPQQDLRDIQRLKEPILGFTAPRNLASLM
jgi:hypothetical protein